MKLWEKQSLTRLVVEAINNEQSMSNTVKKLSRLGFKPHTIRAYYKTFNNSNLGQ